MSVFLKVLNPFNTAASAKHLPVTALTSLLEDDVTLTREPDVKLTAVMDFNMVDNPRFHNKDYYPLAKVCRFLVSSFKVGVQG